MKTSAMIVAVGIAVVLSGCERASILTPPAHYLPGQMYGDGGATECMGACGPCIHQPKQWLKPCGE